jgi:hypothetical protein
LKISKGAFGKRGALTSNKGVRAQTAPWFVEEVMTYYKYTQFLMPEDGLEYDTTLEPGSPAPFSGIN